MLIHVVSQGDFLTEEFVTVHTPERFQGGVGGSMALHIRQIRHLRAAEAADPLFLRVVVLGVSSHLAQLAGHVITPRPVVDVPHDQAVQQVVSPDVAHAVQSGVELGLAQVAQSRVLKRLPVGSEFKLVNVDALH